MKIIFNEKNFDLRDEINITDTRLQASIILKENNNLDEIVKTVKDAEEISICDGGEVIGKYTGYTKVVAVTLHESDVVSIELENENLKEKINELSKKIEKTQAEQNEVLDTLMMAQE